MTTTTRVFAGLLAVTAIASAENPGTQAKKGEPTSKTERAHATATFLNVADMKWMAAPPDLPKGLQMAVLHGDPTKAEAFTVRLKVPDGGKIPAHWHSQDEQLTIISGTLVLRMADDPKAAPHVLETGGYHYLPGGMRHTAEARGETVVQITGRGPFDISYVNRADNPNPRSAKR